MDKQRIRLIIQTDVGEFNDSLEEEVSIKSSHLRHNNQGFRGEFKPESDSRHDECGIMSIGPFQWRL